MSLRMFLPLSRYSRLWTPTALHHLHLLRRQPLTRLHIFSWLAIRMMKGKLREKKAALDAKRAAHAERCRAERMARGAKLNAERARADAAKREKRDREEALRREAVALGPIVVDPQWETELLELAEELAALRASVE